MQTIFGAPLAATILLVLACGGRPAPVTSPETPPLPIASDAAAETLLVDVRSADSTIQAAGRRGSVARLSVSP